MSARRMRVRTFFPFFMAGLLGCVSSGSPSGPGFQDDLGLTPQVLEHVLENGLRLFIIPRPGVPIASFVVYYRIGGVNEEPGNTGIAHLLEHLLFKGTTS